MRRYRALLALFVVIALGTSQLFCAEETPRDESCLDIAGQVEGIPNVEATFAARPGAGDGGDVTGELGLRAGVVLRRSGSEALLFITKGTLSDAVMGTEFTFGARYDVTRLLEASVGDKLTLTADLRTTIADGAECDETRPQSIEVTVVESVGRFDPSFPRLDREFRRVLSMRVDWTDSGCGLKRLSGETTFKMLYASFSHPCGVPEAPLRDAGADGG